jgi:hypothetical protein
MNDTGKQMRTEMEANVEQLCTLRDDVRVKLHLAKMDAKDRWRELEPRITAVLDQAARSTSAVSRQVVTDAIHALEKLRDSI